MKKIKIELVDKFKILSEGLYKSNDFCEYDIPLSDRDEKQDFWNRYGLRASLDKKIVAEAQIKVKRSSSLTGAIINIYITPKYRRKGIGLQLLKDILRRCEGDLDCQFVKAMIGKTNFASEELFKKAGFNYSGEYPDRYKNGQLVLFNCYYKYFRETKRENKIEVSGFPPTPPPPVPPDYDVRSK